MANDDLVIVNGSGVTAPDPKPAWDSEKMKNTVELKLVTAYAKRKRPEAKTAEPPEAESAANGTTPTSPEGQKEQSQKEKKRSKKKKKGWRRLPIIGQCIRSKTKEEEPEPAKPEPEGVLRLRSNAQEASSEEEPGCELDLVALRLTKITDEIQFVPPEIETDSPDDLEKVIGLLLREKGDELSEKMKESNISVQLFSSYSVFEYLLRTFLERIGYRNSRPDDLRPQASKETQVAVACEITSRLATLDPPLENQMLSFGAEFLQQYYPNWVEQQREEGNTEEEVD